MEVAAAGALAGGAPRALDDERDLEARAERAAGGLVALGLRPQPVVDVQGAHGLAAGHLHGDVEQADRVASPGEQDDDGAAAGEQAARAHPREEVLRRHPPSSSAGWARKSSVEWLNPFRRTSPIGSKARCGPEASTTGRVTMTSPPPARAATREAVLTSRPK